MQTPVGSPIRGRRQLRHLLISALGIGMHLALFAISISIVDISTLLKNIDINRTVLENNDIDNEILENINIDMAILVEIRSWRDRNLKF